MAGTSARFRVGTTEEVAALPAAATGGAPPARVVVLLHGAILGLERPQRERAQPPRRMKIAWPQSWSGARADQPTTKSRSLKST